MNKTNNNPGRPEGEEGIAMLERMNKSHAPLRDFAFSHIVWTDEMKILDAGCGGGAAISQMLGLSKNCTIDGLDYTKESIDTASEFNKAEIGSRVNLHLGSVMHLPFEDNTYDLVTAVETIYFWPDIKTSFEEIKRVLKPGGIFAVINEGSDPDNHSDWPDPEQIMHIYRPEEIKAFMRANGFESIVCTHGEGEYIIVQGQCPLR